MKKIRFKEEDLLREVNTMLDEPIVPTDDLLGKLRGGVSGGTAKDPATRRFQNVRVPSAPRLPRVPGV